MFCLRPIDFRKKNAKKLVGEEGLYLLPPLRRPVPAIKLNYSHKNTPSFIILLVSLVIESSEE